MERNGRIRQRWGEWLFVCALFALCGVLGMLQYHAIAEVSIAARERLRSSLEASLLAVDQDFNAALSTSAQALAPAAPENAQAAANRIAALYAQGNPNARYRRLFSRISLAVPRGRSVDLLDFQPQSGVWTAGQWPEAWNLLHSRFASTLDHHEEEDRPGPSDPPARNLTSALEIPLFGAPARPPGSPPGARPEVAWLILDVDLAYVRETLLPEILQRHLGADYQAELTTRDTPRQVLYQSDADLPDLAQTADASISLFDGQAEPMVRRPGPRGGPGGGPGGRRGPMPGRVPLPDQGRWILYVRHRAGSLEAVAAQARLRSMAVTAIVLLMLAAALAALIRYTRRARRLADLQMEFVAGVSHELRTPLTVIHTAAYNLRGKLAATPAQVERYGALIQEESGRLKELVEQVLQFAGANAGHVIQELHPVPVERLVEEAAAASSRAIQSAGCVLEKHVDESLPDIQGDAVALRQALANLLANAAKYGAGTSRWIGLSATLAGHRGRADAPVIEIRVADRGPGIPANEQKHIFDPFFRGARAVRNQVHGAGLGLSLVKKIVEAHGGTIELHSEPSAGAEFILRLPAVVPAETSGALAPAAHPTGAAE